MALNLDAVGQSTAPTTVEWTSDDTLLYALGVGAGQHDPTAELAFTTENSHGVPQRVLPTFGVIVNQFRSPSQIDIGAFDPAFLVHAEQRIELFEELPPSGTLEIVTTVTGIYDKGSGALVVTETTGRRPNGIGPVCVTRASMFIRGEGGFGVAGPKESWERPDREPDMALPITSRPEQALLYRLSGDRNPLHSDPDFARRAGFPRPILHGMATYGIVGRSLLGAVASGDPARFRSMSGRFSKPVFPGDTLTLNIWHDADAVRFTVTDRGGAIVLDRGELAVV